MVLYFRRGSETLGAVATSLDVEYVFAPKEGRLPRDVVVIGASAGGVEALQAFVRELPPDLPAAVLVVLHLPSDSASVLPWILGRAGKLPARSAVSGMPLEKGTIYVAPPGSHLILEDDCLKLSNGPKENGMRPAIDPLFRSAARAYGRRVIGIVLSGTLDDGSAGLYAVGRRGGLTIVQDPRDALFRDMPNNAAAMIAVDYSLPVREIGRLLPSLVRDSSEDRGVRSMADDIERDLDIEVASPDNAPNEERPGTPSVYTCPECHGTLWEVQEEEFEHYRCRVGHAYSIDSLAAGQSAALEAALWTALRALQERLGFLHRMANRARARGQHVLAVRFEERAAGLQLHSKTLQDVLGSSLVHGESVLLEDGEAGIGAV